MLKLDPFSLHYLYKTVIYSHVPLSFALQIIQQISRDELPTRPVKK